MGIDCICEYGKNISKEQKTCPYCGVDLTPLHNLKALPYSFYEEGIKLAKQRQWSIAIDKFKTAISLDPRLSEAYLALGNVYFQNGYCDRAVAEYEKALKIEPGSVDIKEAKMRAEKLGMSKESTDVLQITALPDLSGKLAKKTGTSNEPEPQSKEPPTKSSEKKKPKKFGFVNRLSKSASRGQKNK